MRTTSKALLRGVIGPLESVLEALLQRFKNPFPSSLTDLVSASLAEDPNVH